MAARLAPAAPPARLALPFSEYLLSWLFTSSVYYQWSPLAICYVLASCAGECYVRVAALFIPVPYPYEIEMSFMFEGRLLP